MATQKEGSRGGREGREGQKAQAVPRLGWGSGLCYLGRTGGGGCRQCEGSRLGWLVNGPFGCPSLCSEEGGQDTQASFSRTEWLCCLSIQRLSVYLLGELDPGSGTGWRQQWPPRQCEHSLPASLYTSHCLQGPGPRQLKQSVAWVLSYPPPPTTLTSGTLEILLQRQRCYYIPFFSPRTFSLEMLVKIPSFPFGVGV